MIRIAKGIYRLLIADSDKNAVMKYKRMTIFRELGIEISDHASSAFSAGECIKSNDIDIVIFHDKPPDMDPAAFTAYLSQQEKAPVCIITASEKNPGRMRECFINGAVDYLFEPLSEEILGEALRRAEEHIIKTERESEYISAAGDYFSELEHSVEDTAFLELLRKYILESEGQILSTHDAAEHFGFNRDYFGRLFRTRTGMTFGTFYKRFRMKYAERLLKTGRYKVCDISAKLGFSEPDYFTTEFRKYIGINPIEAKNQK